MYTKAADVDPRQPVDVHRNLVHTLSDVRHLDHMPPKKAAHIFALRGGGRWHPAARGRPRLHGDEPRR